MLIAVLAQIVQPKLRIHFPPPAPRPELTYFEFSYL